jgi:predicted transcriptional regulator
VVDDHFRLVGIVTARDVAEAEPDDPIEAYMSRNPYTVTLKTTVASAAHRMVWEGIELLPVVQNKKLVAVISRQDVIRALQYMNRQPQVAQTLQDLIMQGFEEVRNDDRSLSLVGEVTPQMTSTVGTLATGPLTALIENCAVLCVQRARHVEMVVENLTLYSIKPISVDTRIEVRARLLDFGRRFAKVDVEVLDGTERMAKALLTTQLLER